MDFVEKYNRHIAIAIIVVTGLLIFWQLPSKVQYSNADEGNYYRQGKLLVDSGFKGFNSIASIFISTPALHDTPNPLRIGAVVFCSVFIKANDSIRAISVFCLLSYLLLLAGTFVFVNRYWGYWWALITLAFMAVSPLEIAMARRALMDMPASAFLALACFCFWPMANTGKKIYIIGFIALFTIAISIRETGVLMFPFFFLFLCYMKWRNRTPLSLLAITAVTAAAPVIMAALYILIFGENNIVSILHILREPSRYNALWGGGPWFRPVIDYTTLSPFIMALAAAFAGYQLLRGKIELNTAFMMTLGFYVLLSYAPLPKNVRYCLLLDLPLRFMAAGYIIRLYFINRRKNLMWIAPMVFGILLASDLWSFYHYFIKGQVYDPVSYNLMQANHTLPSADDMGYVETPNGAESIKSVKVANDAIEAVEKNPSAANYATLAWAYYMEGKRLESILANREVIRLEPSNAGAYYHIGATYISLKEWDNAIHANLECLKIDSTYNDARTNLEYASQMKQKSQ